MYGFCRLGVIPAPSSGAGWVANGLATATTRNAKNVEMAANTGTTQTIRSRAQLRLSVTAAAPNPVRTSSHNRREPSWPPQKAEIVYAVGSALLVVRATYSNEKSLRRSAERRTAAATAVAPNEATRAFWADRASLLRPSRAAAVP